MTRSLRTVLAVLGAVLALGIGLVGTATVGNAAAAVTKAQVKKIAKKVVRKSASGLTVRNAANLAGKPASAYLDDTRVYAANVPEAAPVTQAEFPVPVGPGSYLVGYSVFMAGDASNGGCELDVYAGPDLLRYTATEVGGFGFSGSAVVTLSGNQTLRLNCYSMDGNTFHTEAGNPNQVTVTPLDKVTTGGALTPLSRPGATRTAASAK